MARVPKLAPCHPVITASAIGILAACSQQANIELSIEVYCRALHQFRFEGQGGRQHVVNLFY